MTCNTLLRTLGAGLVLTTATLGLAGCEMQATGQLGADQQILATCPPDDQKVAEMVLADGTTSGKTDATDAMYLDVIEALARRTAICGGKLTVVAFSASSGSTATIFDEEIEVDGATDISRLRKVPAKVDEVMAEITATYDSAMSSLPEGGTDVVGLYRLLGEYSAQQPNYRLEGTILSDGLNNLGINTEQQLSADQATALADQVNLPTLPADSTITVAGLGKVAEGTLPSTTIEGLVAFYTRLCDNTGASTCLAVTDWR